MADGVILPLKPSIANYRVGTTLDGTAYVFDVRWNGRDAAWYLDVRDAEANIIRRGIRIVLGALLGRRCTDPRFPRGVLFASDLSGEQREAGFDDLGTRVRVYFYTPAEYLELVGG